MRSVPEWIGKTDDTPIPERVMDRVRERDGWRCQGCGRQLHEGDRGEIDHAIAICNGGINHEDNLWLLCPWCHREKTRDDVAIKSKSYRIRRRRAGVRKARGRGFLTNKTGPFKKRMDGTVERRS